MMLGLMVAVYQPTRQITRWSWEHFQQAQSLLEEARDRKAELEHALAELMHANRQLDLLNEKLAGMRLIAEEAQKAKTAFVAKVSHEFRTPLNMIIGLTDLLAETPEVYDEELPPPLLEDLKIVQRNCEHLSSMVNDVLDLSQAEAGHMALHREWVDLTEAVASAMAVVSPLLEKKGLDLQAIIPDDLPKVYCDRTRIRQVILNLVSNAARFTEEGGITIHVAQEAQYVVVSVADTGPGISPEDADRIFEPFCQGSSTLWRDKGGSGLGLSISKQFVELHGGRIWLKSEPGMGSTFSFKLPVFPATALVVGPEHRIGEDWVWTERTSRPDPPRLPLKERVVIYDETGGLYPWLTHYSDEVEFVETGNLAQTVQELRRCPAHAVILNTPSPDTLWPMAERASLEMPDTPVIGCSLLPQIERALKAGATDYLIKPVKRTNLEEAIQAVGKPVKRVLVVDDEPDVLQLLARMLSVCDNKLEVATASNGEQALEELRDRAPDLILLDIMMPDMDGWQVLELKNRDEATKDIPVVIISAQDPAELPTTSKMLLATIGGGLPVNQLLRCSLELSALLLKHGGEPAPTPV
jgi:signal transduction histidine kinase/CheY-like chemotaxis protein